MLKECISSFLIFLCLLPGCAGKEDELTAGLTEDEKKVLWLDTEVFDSCCIRENDIRKYYFYTPDSIYVEQIKTSVGYTEYRYYPGNRMYDRILYYSSGSVYLKSHFLDIHFSPTLDESTRNILSACGKWVSFDKKGNITEVFNYTGSNFVVTKQDMLDYIGKTDGYVQLIGYLYYDREVENPVETDIPKMSYIQLIYPDGDTRFVSFDARTGDLLRDDFLYRDRLTIRDISIYEDSNGRKSHRL
ncbi:MAG: hypothetical protein LIP01_08820 [Tannerellaceae bacterium]|nr:hypothetical protein [Tannerellaceae bacterium]